MESIILIKNTNQESITGQQQIVQDQQQQQQGKNVKIVVLGLDTKTNNAFENNQGTQFIQDNMWCKKVMLKGFRRDQILCLVDNKLNTICVKARRTDFQGQLLKVKKTIEVPSNVDLTRLHEMYLEIDECLLLKAPFVNYFEDQFLNQNQVQHQVEKQIQRQIQQNLEQQQEQQLSQQLSNQYLHDTDKYVKIIRLDGLNAMDLTYYVDTLHRCVVIKTKTEGRVLKTFYLPHNIILNLVHCEFCQQGLKIVAPYKSDQQQQWNQNGLNIDQFQQRFQLLSSQCDKWLKLCIPMPGYERENVDFKILSNEHIVKVFCTKMDELNQLRKKTFTIPMMRNCDMDRCVVQFDEDQQCLWIRAPLLKCTLTRSQCQQQQQQCSHHRTPVSFAQFQNDELKQFLIEMTRMPNKFIKRSFNIMFVTEECVKPTSKTNYEQCYMVIDLPVFDTKMKNIDISRQENVITMKHWHKFEQTVRTHECCLKETFCLPRSVCDHNKIECRFMEAGVLRFMVPCKLDKVNGQELIYGTPININYRQ